MTVVARRDPDASSPAAGNLEPARQVDVNFATSGKITKVYAKAGAHVSKGELLARLDDRSAKVAWRRRRPTWSTPRTR